MTLSAEPLMALATSLGISADGLAQAEGPKRFARVFPVEGSSVAVALTEPVLDSLRAEYGTSLKLTFSTGELEEFTYDGSYSSSDLATFIARAAQAPELQLTLEVNKQHLVKGLLGPTPECQAVLYFTTRALISDLKGGLVALAREIWPDPSRRLLLLVMGEENLRLRRLVIHSWRTSLGRRTIRSASYSGGPGLGTSLCSAEGRLHRVGHSADYGPGPLALLRRRRRR